MGFTSGFTGGVALTLGLAYLAVQGHQRNRQAQGEALRAQAHLLDTLSAPSDPRPAEPAPWTTYAQHHPSLIDRAKERWNAEVAGAARWVQGSDVTGAVEGTFGRVLERAVGGIEDGSVARTADRVESAAADKVDGAADATKGAVASLVDKARAAVGTVQEKLSVTASKGSAVVAAEGKLSAVERALQQRYAKSEDVMKKSVEEVLRERYTPIAEKDNTVLRGL